MTHTRSAVGTPPDSNVLYYLLTVRLPHDISGYRAHGDIRAYSSYAGAYHTCTVPVQLYFVSLNFFSENTCTCISKGLIRWLSAMAKACMPGSWLEQTRHRVSIAHCTIQTTAKQISVVHVQSYS